MYVSNNKTASLEFGKVPNEICISTDNDDVQCECYILGQRFSVVSAWFIALIKCCDL